MSTDEEVSSSSLKIPRGKGEDSKAAKATPTKSPQKVYKKQAKQFGNVASIVTAFLTGDTKVTLPVVSDDESIDEFVIVFAIARTIPQLNTFLKANDITLAGAGRTKELKVRALISYKIHTDTEEQDDD